MKEDLEHLAKSFNTFSAADGQTLQTCGANWDHNTSNGEIETKDLASGIKKKLTMFFDYLRNLQGHINFWAKIKLHGMFYRGTDRIAYRICSGTLNPVRCFQMRDYFLPEGESNLRKD